MRLLTFNGGSKQDESHVSTPYPPKSSLIHIFLRVMHSVTEKVVDKGLAFQVWFRYICSIEIFSLSARAYFIRAFCVLEQYGQEKHDVTMECTMSLPSSC